MNIETENLRIKKRLDLIQNSLKMADVRAGQNIKIIKQKRKSLSEKIIAESYLNIDEEDELNDE
jgi:hypothetical protein